MEMELGRPEEEQNDSLSKKSTENHSLEHTKAEKSDTNVQTINEMKEISCEMDEVDVESCGIEARSNIKSNPDIDIKNVEHSSGNFSGVRFKKPVVLADPKRLRATSKISKVCDPVTGIKSAQASEVQQDDISSPEPQEPSSEKNEQERSKDHVSYVEPPWGGLPDKEYKMEVLKSGVITEIISLNKLSFHLVGRLPSCDLSLAHPTISRHHAVLQYRLIGDETNPKGLYVYDLGSTHGTFWNGSRIKPNIYVRVQGGHMIKFGCSQRKYILQAPLEDQEEESEYSVSQLKQKRMLELEKQRLEIESKLDEEKAAIDKKASEGIDWGMREDADEATDLEENPFASIADEDLVLDDPKKTLRGWFEREGYDLHYQTEEKGVGQFLCWVDLPIEGITGRSVRADALVKGKKKEAVVQCALEACRILDKYGLLRQANHEARKRKTRNWEEADYYDSDEDNFLDRTGSVEKKRENRMRLAGKLEEKVETYDSLLKKHEEVTKRISYLSNSIENWQNPNSKDNGKVNEEDALDAFMSTISSSAFTKSDIGKMKLQLQNLRKEESDLVKLLNLTRPANLPPLTCETTTFDERKYQSKSKTNVKKIPIKKTHTNSHTNVETSRATSSIAFNESFNVESEEEEEDSDTESNEQTLPNTTDLSNTTEDRVKENSTECNASSKDSSRDETNKPQQKSRETEKRAKPESISRPGKNSREKLRKMACDQDVYKDNYSTWVPPQNQAGDGKTSLNEKYGY